MIAVGENANIKYQQLVNIVNLTINQEVNYESRRAV